MTNDIGKLYNELKKEYSDGDYVSRETIFSRALNDGKIEYETWNKAKLMYGSLWDYVGD